MKCKLLEQIWYMTRLTLYGTIIQCIMLSVLFAADINAQRKSIDDIHLDLDLRNSSIKQALKVIEKETGLYFAYADSSIDKKIKIDYSTEDATLRDVLSYLAEKSSLQFRRVNETINVSKKIGNNITVTETISVLIQGKEVSGRVISQEDGEGLPGVNVIVKGTSQGSVSDVEGNYKLEVPDESSILVFSSVGFTTEEIVVGNQSVIDLAMVADLTALEEIVVIGYGTAKKSDLTGSVSNVSSEKLMDRPAINIGEALQNKVSGVQVIRSGGGVPGSRPVIRIRGTNSINTNSDPLFVVDGIIGVSNALQNINPNDIMSMDILKDASATAIYGTRGANGVVIITTKRGEVGKTKVTYNGSMTLGTIQRRNYTVTTDQFFYLYEQAFNNTPKYGTLKTEKDYRGGKGTGASWSEMPHLFEQVSQGGYFMDLVGNDGNYYKPRFYSDWEDLVFNNAFSYDNYVDISGGSENAKFSLSIGNTNQQGLMKDSYYKRTNAKVTGDIKINKWLDLSSSIMYSRSKTSRTDGEGRTVAETWPILPTKYPDDPEYGIFAGNWSTGRDFPVGENWRNILYVLDQTKGYDRNEQFTGGLTLNAQITNDLSFKSNLSVDSRSNNRRRFRGDYQGTRNSDARGSNETWFYWQNENYFTYNKTVGDNTFIGMVGLSWQESTNDFLEARASKFASNFYSFNNLDAGANVPRARSANSRWALNSYFARINYGYKDKYLLTVTGRYDGSSKFGPNNKYAFFPSIGGAWRISKEDFMNGGGVLSDLKLRASAGQTGNQEIGSFVTQRYINSANVMFGGGLQAGLYPGSTGNPNLRWETTTQYNMGFDIGLFKNRITLVIDGYYKLTDDMLFNLPLPESSAPSSSFVNYGSVENAGIELDISTINIETESFSWDSRLNFTANRNKILELGPTGADVYRDTGAGNATSAYRVGESIGSFFGLNRMGVYGTDEAALAARYGRVPGDLKFEDVNQDGKIELITDGDIIGQSYPKYYGGFSNTFRYKNFDASIDIQFVGGVDKAIVHESASDRQFVSGMVNAVLNAWRPDYQKEGIMVAQVRAGNAGARYDSFTDTYQMYNAAFIRGSMASVGYTLNDLAGISRLRIYATAENFFLLTPIELEGYDPEGSSLGKGRDNVQNIDKYQYPRPTNFSLGVNLSF